MGRHALSTPRLAPARLGVTAAVAVLVAVGVMIAAVVAAHPAHSARPTPARPTPASAVQAPPAAVAVAAVAAPPRAVAPAGGPAYHAVLPLTLTAADRQHCPATATACVDLVRHLTWLQAKGKVTFGPVQMLPGKPGGGHETPLGAFQVEWKAGPTYMSNTYHEPMPWATFFATGGIAFHGGSLTDWSHGCVHLTDTNAHYYNEHLPLGARVIVF
jgi:hypothetical protein